MSSSHNVKDAWTNTELSFIGQENSSEYLDDSNTAEVELVSIVHNPLPKYRLRADSLTQYTGYSHTDWGRLSITGEHEEASSYYISPPNYPCTEQELKQVAGLTTEQIESCLDYFILCGLRVSQMTKTYNDIEAVTQLLEEKERDLELAAKIGKSLLEKNKELEAKLEEAENHLLVANDRVKQLTHDLSLKDDLLQVYCQSDTSPPPSPFDSDSRSSLGQSSFSFSSINVDHFQTKIKKLEDENNLLRESRLAIEENTNNLEEKEQILVKDCVRQLVEANVHIRTLSDDLNRKSELYAKQHEEVAHHASKVMEMESKLKIQQIEYDHLYHRFKESQESQNSLSRELSSLRDKYDECLGVLNDTQDELRTLKKKSRASQVQPYLYPVQGAAYYPYPPAMHHSMGGNSLATELQNSYSHTSTAFKNGGPAILTEPGMRAMTDDYSVCDDDVSLATSPGASEHPSPFHTGGMAVPPPPWSVDYRPVAAGGALPPHLQYLGVGNPHNKVETWNVSVEGRAGGLTDNETSFHSDLSEISLSREIPPETNQSSGQLRPLDIDATIRSIQADSDRVRNHNARRQRSRANPQFQRPGDEDAEPASGRESPNRDSPPSYLSTGSQRIFPASHEMSKSALSSDGSGAGMKQRLAHKLQIVKPMEGSYTLRQWQHLATPSLTRALFEDQPGVRMRGQKEDGDSHGRRRTASRTFSDIDDNSDDYNKVKAKCFESMSGTFTYTTARILHPDDDYRFPITTSTTGDSGLISTSSTQLVTSSKSRLPSSSSVNNLSRTGTTTFSLNLNLANLLNERGIRSKTYDELLTDINRPESASGNPLRFPSLMRSNLSRSGESDTAELYKSSASSSITSRPGSISSDSTLSDDNDDSPNQGPIHQLQSVFKQFSLGSLVASVLPAHSNAESPSKKPSLISNLTTSPALAKMREPPGSIVGLNALSVSSHSSQASAPPPPDTGLGAILAPATSLEGCVSAAASTLDEDSTPKIERRSVVHRVRSDSNTELSECKQT